MSEENSKIPTGKTSGGTVYKRVISAGLAAEVTAGDPVAPETVTALGRWLREKLGSSPTARERVATLSGLSVTDLTSLMDGHPEFRLDTDHVQQIATALVEAQVIPHADEVWKALGTESGSSEYILPPTQVVRAMSQQ